SSRFPVMSVGSSSSLSGPLRALEPEGSLRAAVPAAVGLRAAPGTFASAATAAEGVAAAGVTAAGALLEVSTAVSRCSGRGRARAGACEPEGLGGADSCARAVPTVSGHKAMRTDSTATGLNRYTHTRHMVNLLLSRRCCCRRRSQHYRRGRVARAAQAPRAARMPALPGLARAP